MRKPRRLTPEELAPYQWQMPRTRRQETGDRRQETPRLVRSVAESAVPCPLSPVSLDWAALFGNPHPVEIEVGMGKGLFLLTEATARPEVNFFGIEIARKYQLYATSRFAVRGLANVKTVCADARWVLQQFVLAGSVATVHVLFPDPWWKARHKKRRVFTPGFAADAARVLPPGGRFHIASDVAEYFGVMTGIVGAMPAFRELSNEANAAPVGEAGYRTNFERKARLRGTPIGQAWYERTAQAEEAAR